MDTIITKPPPDEYKSPFKSPSRAERRNKSSPKIMKAESTSKKKKTKRKGSPNPKDKSGANFEIKKAPPIQYKLIKIKTSVGNFPILNVNPPFTNKEIKLANKCKLNGWTEPPPEFSLNATLQKPVQKDRKNFKLDVSPIKEEDPQEKIDETKEPEDKPQVLDPKTRSAGGLWLQAADFPFCFQYFIIFHNDQKIRNKKVHKEICKFPVNNFKSKIYIRVRDPNPEELKEEEDKKNAEENAVDLNMSTHEFPKDKKKRVLIAFSPNATSKAAEKLPRYYCRVRQLEAEDSQNKQESNHINLSGDDDKDVDMLFSHYFSGQMMELDEGPKYILCPQIYAPFGYCLWIASESRIEILKHTQF